MYLTQSKAGDHKVSIRDYLSVVSKRWVSIVIFTVIGVGVAAAMTVTAPKIYTATAQNFVALAGGSADSSALSGAQFAAQRVKSYTEIVGSPDVLQPVIEELGLTSSVAGLASSITVTNPPGTVLLLVSATSPIPERAAQVANAVSLQLGRVVTALETPNSQSNSPVKVTLTEPAVPPRVPSSPIARTNITVGLLFGLAAGLAFAFIRDGLDNTVKTVSELENITGLPLLGVVAHDNEARKRVLSALDSTAAQSEGYRTIRANLQFVSVDNPVRAFVVTSAVAGDGKSTVACNLALALAQTGRRVCLVEADLRRPRLEEYMGLTPRPGLTEVLAGQEELADVVTPWGREMIHVLQPGSIPPNPSEILASQQMSQVLERLRSQYTAVVIDTPPLMAVSDAGVLAAQVDGALLVVRHGKTTRDSLRHAHDALNRMNAQVLGVVLNDVPVKRGSGYGYGYGYGSEHFKDQRRDAKNASRAETALGTVQ